VKFILVKNKTVARADYCVHIQGSAYSYSRTDIYGSIQTMPQVPYNFGSIELAVPQAYIIPLKEALPGCTVTGSISIDLAGDKQLLLRGITVQKMIPCIGGWVVEIGYRSSVMLENESFDDDEDDWYDDDDLDDDDDDDYEDYEDDDDDDYEE